jgi:predicted helicase
MKPTRNLKRIAASSSHPILWSHLYWSDALENSTGNVPFNVILGNPPYSGHSSNKSQWISEKIKDYYAPKEKNLKWLQDDYVKFIRFAHEKINENGSGDYVLYKKEKT